MWSRRSRLAGVVAAVALAAAATTAAAVVAPGPARAEPAPWPRRAVDRPLRLAPGMVEVRLAAELSLSAGAVGEPVAIAPDVWVGVNRRLTLGVTHSWAARGGLGAGRGLCLGATAEVADGGCPGRYDAVALDARFAIPALGDDTVGLVALDARRLSPATVALEVGVASRWRSGDLAVVVAPVLALGLARRDLGNQERVRVPVTVQWQAADRVALTLTTGFTSTADDLFGDLAIVVGAGAAVTVRDDLDLGVAAGLPRALGGAGQGGTDERYATAWLTWRR
ncbi:MAG: hypothetical protein H6708_13140 [Kofleriaceae bacterium]|nr:hypothetical protein [Kofleriaceae bacterium]